MIVVALIFVATAVFLGVRWFSRRSKKATSSPKPQERFGSGMLQSVRPLIQQLAAAGQRVPLLGLKERYAHQIERAGLPFELSGDEFLGIKAGVLVIAIGVALVFYVFVYPNWMIALAIMFIGVVLPDLRLSSAVKKQEHDFLRALPSFLDLLALSVEAGMGFDAAVLRLTEVLEPGPLVWRFQAFLRSANVGKTRVEAMREMVQKVDLPDFTTFANVVIQATETGASMGPVLRTASAEMLSRRFDRAEKTAHELPVKMLLPLFVFVFPATFVMILGPVYFQFKASGAAGVL